MFLSSFGIVAFPDDRGLVGALGQMAVDAVVGDVQRAVLEPFDRDVARRERGVLDLVERLDPVDALGLLGPEAVRVGDRALVHLLVLGLVDEGALLPLGGNLVDLVVGHRLLHAQPRFRARPRDLACRGIMRRRADERQGGAFHFGRLERGCQGGETPNAGMRFARVLLAVDAR